VTIGLLALAVGRDPDESRLHVSVCETRPGNGLLVWLAPSRLDKLRPVLHDDGTLVVTGQPGLPPLEAVRIAPDPSLPACLAAASPDLMEGLVLTLGEVITLRAKTA
jgi:hypothetical protein